MQDNKEKGRYELVIDGEIVFANYQMDGDVMNIKHVEAPEVLRGTGAAGKLMLEIASKAKADNLKIRPICGYAASWLKRHNEYNTLVV